MSYDVFLETDTGSQEWVEIMFVGSYTANIAPMCCRALPPGGITMLDGKKAGRVATALWYALKRMMNNPIEFVRLNPNIGWGDYSAAIAHMRYLADACTNNPTATIRVHA